MHFPRLPSAIIGFDKGANKALANLFDPSF
jgi:hypothetical protein